MKKSELRQIIREELITEKKLSTKEIEREIYDLSSGTIATLIGKSDYKKIEMVRKWWVKYATKENPRPHSNWQESWKDFANAKQMSDMATSKGRKALGEAIITEDFKDFTEYMNMFYGKKGTYPNLKKKDLTQLQVQQAVVKVLSKRPKHRFDGDSVDREFARDELIKMGVLKLNESITEEIEESKIITQMRDIVDRHQAKKIGGQLVDAFTAQHVVALYDAISDKNKQHMNKLKLAPLVNMTWVLFKKHGK
jgi:hypothetical protein